MNSAVALAQAYLYTNGYFTVSEYPVVEAVKHGGYRASTDIDLLAVRFPGAGRLIPRRGRSGAHDERLPAADPALDPSPDRVDMLIAEVKEGRAELNRGARDPSVLRAVLTRFGACTADHSGAIVHELMQHGEAISPSGPRVRLVAFGSYAAGAPETHCAVITLKQVTDFFRELAGEHWDVVRQAHFKDPALGFLTLLEKVRRAGP